MEDEEVLEDHPEEAEAEDPKTEIYFEKSLWPDFNKDLLTEAINDFNNRYRRYGKIEERLKNDITWRLYH